MQIQFGTAIVGYEILDLLGRGGQSAVYKARDIQLRRHVAIKFLSESLLSDETCRKRFLLEAQTLSSLHHPNIATVFHIGEYEGTPYIVMECVEGLTLQKHMQAHRSDARARLRLMVKIAEAIRYAHERGVVHRDLKPGNILVTPDGEPKLVDFGLARIVQEAERERLDIQREITTTGAVMGTASYLSPEQAQSEPVGERSDLFSLGVVYYEMITGKRPFDRDSTLSTLFAVLHSDPPPMETPTSEERALKPVVDRLLRKDPSDRYPSAAALLDDLRDLEQHSSDGTTRRIQPLTPRRWRKSLILIGLCAAISALAATAVWRTFFSGPAPGRPAKGGRTEILVLPIQAGPDEQNRRLGDLITAEIISSLSRTPHLRVLSIPHGTRGSVEAWTEKILAKNNVAFTLSGELSISGTQLRLAAQILDQRDYAVVWSRQFQEDVDRIYTIPPAIAARLAFEAGVIVKADQLEFPGREAFDYYTRGDLLLSSYDPATLPQSISLFKECARVAPRFRPVYEKLSLAFMQYRNTGLDYNPDYLDEAYRYIRKGRELQPGAPYLRTLEAWYYLYTYDFKKAGQLLQGMREERLESGGSMKCQTWLSFFFGQTDQAVEYLEQSVQLEPFDSSAHLNRVVLNAMLGDAKRVGQAYAEGREVFGSPMLNALMKGWWRMGLNDFAGAAEAFQIPGAAQYRLLSLASAEALFAQGLYREAIPHLDAWLKRNPYAVEGWWMLCLCQESAGDRAGQRASASRAAEYAGRLHSRYPNAFLRAARLYFGTLAGSPDVSPDTVKAMDLSGHDTVTRYLREITLARLGQTEALDRITAPYSPTYWLNRFFRQEVALVRGR